MELKDIKTARVRLGITQMQLAKEAGVSQSVIAKIESGRIDPSFSTAQRIFSALEQRRMSNSPKAIDVMHPSVISVKPSDTVAEAVKIMRKYAISQVPVFDAQVVGLITESTIIAHMHELEHKVEDIMEAAPPTVPLAADLLVVSGLLQHYPLVLVVEKGNLVGLITKSDIIGALV
jgi:predicted transcriptional regulator